MVHSNHAFFRCCFSTLMGLWLCCCALDGRLFAQTGPPGPLAPYSQDTDLLQWPLEGIHLPEESLEGFSSGPWYFLGDDDLPEDLVDRLMEASEEAEPVDEREGTPSINVTGQVQSDFVWSGQTARNRQTVGNIPDGTFFRRARLGTFGEIFERKEYRIEFDFVGDGARQRPRFLDNWVSVLDIPLIENLIIGHYFEPFSLERYTPNRFMTFMERSLADTFAPARNMGAMTYRHAENERATMALGVFRSESNLFGDDASHHSGWATTGHFTFLPVFRDEGRQLWHVGASYSYRMSGDHRLRFSSRPEMALNAFEREDGMMPAFVDTGDIAATRHQLFGIESAMVYGPFSLQSEVIWTPVKRIDGPDPSFMAAYVYGSFFLTGENRSYSPTHILGRFREGIFQRIEPRTIAFPEEGFPGIEEGLGAWEIALRVSHLDLNSHDIQGGRLTNITLGVNWYLNAHTRITSNYVHSMLDDPTRGKSHAHLFGKRVQFEY